MSFFRFIFLILLIVSVKLCFVYNKERNVMPQPQRDFINLEYHSTGLGQRNNVERFVRNTLNGRFRKHQIECLICDVGISKLDEDCYLGNSLNLPKTFCSEQCYIELNPKYIKRGCVSPSRLNRTFVCKCPLCNDKSFNDRSYYEYKNLRDWEYDNNRSQHSLKYLVCKVCETRDINTQADRICKQGIHADYMLCGYNQICYTNINEASSYVSRGCVDLPAYNSFIYFCNDTLCNSGSFKNLKTHLSSDFLIEDFLSTKLVSSGMTNNCRHLEMFFIFILKTVVM